MSVKLKLLLCYVVVVIGIANFIAFAWMDNRLGGSAINGMVKDGHYYVMSHGKYTEVSEADFAYSRWHTYSVWITHPMAILAVYFIVRLTEKQKKETEARVPPRE